MKRRRDPTNRIDALATRDLETLGAEARSARWLNKKEPIRAAELIQFGGGPHFCLGYHMAWMESVQFLVAMARHLGDAGLKPAHQGPYPAIRYIPLLHPDPKTRVTMVAA